MDDLVWWFFWVGIYVDPKDSSAFASHFPMYILITLLVLEKVCQRWLTNRYGCNLEKVREFKILEEKIKRYEVEEIKQKIAESAQAKSEKQEEENKKDTDKGVHFSQMSSINKSQIVKGMLRMNEKRFNERGEEIVNIKEKLSTYFNEISS